jgi:hypothetical protein
MIIHSDEPQAILIQFISFSFSISHFTFHSPFNRLSAKSSLAFSRIHLNPLDQLPSLKCIRWLPSLFLFPLGEPCYIISLVNIVYSIHLIYLTCSSNNSLVTRAFTSHCSTPDFYLIGPVSSRPSLLDLTSIGYCFVLVTVCLMFYFSFFLTYVYWWSLSLVLLSSFLFLHSTCLISLARPCLPLRYLFLCLPPCFLCCCVWLKCYLSFFEP